jgi:phage gpG-like protein
VARVEVSSDGDPGAALRALVEQRVQATRKALAKSAHLVERHAKVLLSLSSHPKGTPTPSRPGQPPSLVTGTLKRSVKVRGPRRTSSGFEAVIGPTAVYGRIQELGGLAGRGLRSRLPARPYMRPAMRQSIPGIRAIFGSEWRL